MQAPLAPGTSKAVIAGAASSGMEGAARHAARWTVYRAFRHQFLRVGSPLITWDAPTDHVNSKVVRCNTLVGNAGFL